MRPGHSRSEYVDLIRTELSHGSSFFSFFSSMKRKRKKKKKKRKCKTVQEVSLKRTGHLCIKINLCVKINQMPLCHAY